MVRAPPSHGGGRRFDSYCVHHFCKRRSVVASNIRDLIRKLVAIQKIDEDLFAFRREIRDKPEEMAQLEGSFEKKKQVYHALELRLREIELSRKAKELDLKSKELEIIKADASLMMLKTNKEYQTRLFEIENIKADKSILEDEVLRLMDEVERAAKALTDEKVLVDAEEKKFKVAIEKIEADVARLKADSAGLEALRQDAMQGVDKVPLELYERIVENRDGVAIVPIVNNACGGCFMHLPPQVINKIKMYEDVVRCEVCARLLYLQEDL